MKIFPTFDRKNKTDLLIFCDTVYAINYRFIGVNCWNCSCRPDSGHAAADTAEDTDDTDSSRTSSKVPVPWSTGAPRTRSSTTYDTFNSRKTRYSVSIMSAYSMEKYCVMSVYQRLTYLIETYSSSRDK